MRKALPILLIVLAVTVVYRDVVFFGRYLFLDDITTLTNPFWRYMGRRISDGELPLWSPEIFCGFPLISSVQFGPLYPVNHLLYGILPVGVGTNMTVVFHTILAGALFYLFLVELLSSLSEEHRASSVPGTPAVGDGPAPDSDQRSIRWSALCGALVFCSNGFIVAYHVAPHGVCTMAWTGAILWAIERSLNARARRTPRPRSSFFYSLLAGGFFGIALLAGHTQHAYYIAGVAVCYACVRNWRCAPATLAAMAVVAVGLFAVQLLPSYELSRLSARSDVELRHIPPVPRSLWRMTIESIVANFRGGMREEGWFVYPNFVGIACWMGAVAALFTLRKETILFGSLAALGLVLSVGTQTPLFALVYKTVPGFSLFKSPERAGFVFVLSMSVLFAVGVRELARTQSARSAKASAGFFGVAVVASAILGLSQPLSEVMRTLPGRAADFALSQLIAGVLAFVLAGSAAVVLVSVRLPLCLGLVAAAETFVFSTGVVLTIREDITARPPQPAAALQGKGAYRLFRLPMPGPLRLLSVPRICWESVAAQTSIRLREKRGESVPYSNVNDFLAPNIPLGFSLREFFGFSSLTLRRLLEFRDPGRCFHPLFDSYSDKRISSPAVLRSAACRYYACPQVGSPAPNSDRKQSGRFDVAEGLTAFLVPGQLASSPIRLYEADVPPIAYVVGRVIPCRSDEETLRHLAKSDFDPRVAALVEGDVELSDRAPIEHGKAEMAYEGACGKTIWVRGAGDGLLVLAETDYPSWRCWVDGAQRRMIRVNYLFKGVVLPVGDHVVRFAYEPRSFKLGLAITLAVLAALVGAWAGRSRN